MDPAESMKRVFTGTARPIDIGVAHDNNHRTEYWDNSVGIGFDGKINIMSRKIEGLYGFPLYLTAVLRTIATDYESAQMKLTFDDGPTIERTVLMLTLGNGLREGDPCSCILFLVYITVVHAALDAVAPLLPQGVSVRAVLGYADDIAVHRDGRQPVQDQHGFARAEDLVI